MKINSLFILVIALTSCFSDQEFVESSIAKFDDQAYKNIIALVELYKIRNDSYPIDLIEIEFVGDWDMINYDGVVYKKVNDGYILTIDGLILDSISYPNRFYTGLGIIRN